MPLRSHSRRCSSSASAHGSPQVRPTQRVVAEVDYVAVVGVGGAGVDLFAADVGEDGFAVVGVCFDQAMHLGEGRCDALLVGVVEGEAHAEDDASLEAFAGVGLELRRVGMAASVEQEGR